MTDLSLLNAKKYYQALPHQVIAITYLGDILLTTPAKTRLNLIKSDDWISKSDEELVWLEAQLKGTGAYARFSSLYREAEKPDAMVKISPKVFSQLDNYILPYTTCASSTSAAYTDYHLRRLGKGGLQNDTEYLERVFSGKYGSCGSNNSVSWDVQTAVIKSYGINSGYIWDGDLAGLKKEVEQNGCSVINIYHKGTNRATRAGGHIILATEVKSSGMLIHDPYGERPPSYTLKNVGGLQAGGAKEEGVDELDLLNRLILCEARGESLLGLALVARTVLNRVNLVRTGKANFNNKGKDLASIIYAPNQFEPTWSKNNNVSDIYTRIYENTKFLGFKAIDLACSPVALAKEIALRGIEPGVIRSSFFASSSLPGAISPYVKKIIKLDNQVFGESNQNINITDAELFAPYEFKKTVKSNKLGEETVGVYTMGWAEFDFRWEGCYRKLK